MEKQIIAQPFWTLRAEEAFDILESRLEGISQNDVRERRRRWGINELAAKKKTTTFDIFLRQLRSPLIFILIIAGAVTIFLRDVADSIVIFLAVAINSALGFYQEYRAEEALEHLRDYLQERTRVIRDGREQEVDVKEIVPGDIVHVTLGSRVPADARVISAHELQVDESILTGESLPVVKQTESLSLGAELADRSNMAFGGTLVVGGSGVLLVCATGLNTEIGKISRLVAAISKVETPLQKSIRRLAWGIAAVIGILILGIFFLGIARGEPLVAMFLVAVAIAVGAIPEALPVAMTMILAIGVERLARRRAIVKKLGAAESLGSTTVILTDKTGTLTEAHMKLVDIISAVSAHIPPHSQGDGTTLQELSRGQRQVLLLALMNVDVLIENPDDAPSSWYLTGSPLERNIVQACAEHNILLPDIKETYSIVLAHPFNSMDKFSVARVRTPEEFHFHAEGAGVKDFLSIMGAPEILLERSKISKDEFVRLSSMIQALAAEGKRLLGVAVKPTRKFVHGHGEYENIDELLFLGIIAFYDPVRVEVPRAMARVEEFGVRTVMVTGDLQGTALAVGREIGWEVTEANVIEGAALRAMDEATLQGALQNTRIFARVSPEDKVRIVNAYKKAGEIVAMTGDGVNDAPSLKSAHVGVAVGSGTDVAKDVADIILLDNNFKTIAHAIEEGRRILSNIRKTVIYLLSDSLDEILLIGGSLAFGFPLPLTAFQILWVNFFSDSFPALAFAFERTIERTGLSRMERGRILDREAKFLVLVVGVFTSALLFALYGILLASGFEVGLVRSFIFAAFGTYSLFLVFPLKNLEENILSYPFFTNRLMVFGVGLGIALMAFAIYLPPLQRVLGTVALSPVWVAGVFALAAVNICAVEATKWLFRAKRSSL